MGGDAPNGRPPTPADRGEAVVPLDGLRAAVVAGRPAATVARWPGVVCVADCADPVVLGALLEHCAGSAGAAPGRPLARRLSAWLAGPDGPAGGLRFGTIAATGPDQWAVFLFGAVHAHLGDGRPALSGTDAAAWTDRLVSRPPTRAPVVLALSDGGAGGAAPSSPEIGPDVRAAVEGPHDLRAGAVPGAAVVLLLRHGDPPPPVVDTATPPRGAALPSGVAAGNAVPGHADRPARPPSAAPPTQGVTWGALPSPDGDPWPGPAARSGAGVVDPAPEPASWWGPAAAEVARLAAAVTTPPARRAVTDELGGNRLDSRDAARGAGRDGPRPADLVGRVPRSATDEPERATPPSATIPVGRANGRHDDGETDPPSGPGPEPTAAERELRQRADAAVGRVRSLIDQPDDGLVDHAAAPVSASGSASVNDAGAAGRHAAYSWFSATEREATEREATEREAAEREAAEREAGEREAAERAGTAREATEREVSGREAAAREVTGRGIGRDGTQRDGAEYDGIDRELIDHAVGNYNGDHNSDHNGDRNGDRGLLAWSNGLPRRGRRRAVDPPDGPVIPDAAAVVHDWAASPTAGGPAEVDGSAPPRGSVPTSARIDSPAEPTVAADPFEVVVHLPAPEHAPPVRTPDPEPRSGAGGTASDPAAVTGATAASDAREAPFAWPDSLGHAGNGMVQWPGAASHPGRDPVPDPTRSTDPAPPLAAPPRAAETPSLDRAPRLETGPPLDAAPPRDGAAPLDPAPLLDAAAPLDPVPQLPAEPRSHVTPPLDPPPPSAADAAPIEPPAAAAVPPHSIEQALASPMRTEQAAGEAASSAGEPLDPRPLVPPVSDLPPPAAEPWSPTPPEVSPVGVVAPPVASQPVEPPPVAPPPVEPQPVAPGADSAGSLIGADDVGVPPPVASPAPEPPPTVTVDPTASPLAAPPVATVAVRTADTPGPPAPIDDRPDPDVAGPDTPASAPVVGGTVAVAGRRCPWGHLNDPRVGTCTICGVPVDPAGPVVTGPRPPLGLLVFDDGRSWLLDVGYLMGRLPDVDERVRGGALRPLVVEDRSGAVSRSHAEVRLDEWDVLLVDAGSRNGTLIAGPDESAWSRLPAGRPLRVVAGTRVRLGGRTFQVEPPPVPR